MATLFNTRIADTYQGLLKTIDTAVIGATLTQISDGSGNGTGVFLNNAGDLEATGIGFIWLIKRYRRKYNHYKVC